MVRFARLRRWWWLLAAVALLAVAVGWSVWPRPSIAEVQVGRVRLGMTPAEVRGVLAVSPTVERKSPRLRQTWQFGDRSFLHVDFSPDGQVESTGWERTPRWMVCRGWVIDLFYRPGL